ncbi:MAG: ATP-binding protein [Desulfotomaculales bacterium]
METCKICRDRGVVVKGDRAVLCRCAAIRAVERLFKDSCLPEGLRSCTFENFSFRYYSRQVADSPKGLSYHDTARLTYSAALRFVNEFSAGSARDGLLFTGPVGSGKTFLACCIANALLEKGVPVLFLVVPDLLDRIRSTYDANRAPGDPTEQEILDAARKVPLLVLDDLGAHNYTDWVRGKLYSLLNYRLNHALPVIITTNINLEDLEEYLGERTTSRIFQMCRPYRLLVDMDIRVLRRRGGEAF